MMMRYFGLRDQWCRCGNTLPDARLKDGDPQCFNKCPGDPGKICGAGWNNKDRTMWMSLYESDGCMLNQDHGPEFYPVGGKES